MKWNGGIILGATAGASLSFMMTPLTFKYHGVPRPFSNSLMLWQAMTGLDGRLAFKGVM